VFRLCLFGAPPPLDPHEQAERAVRAALEMRDRMDGLTRDWLRRGIATILCAFPAYSLIEDRVRANPLGDRTLEGSTRPVAVFDILGLAREEADREPAQPPPVFLPK
jgi:class 3 adenylate cyclase